MSGCDVAPVNGGGGTADDFPSTTHRHKPGRGASQSSVTALMTGEGWKRSTDGRSCSPRSW